MSMDFISNFFEKQWTQHHPQDLSGLSRALYPTTFLEVAVYIINIVQMNEDIELLRVKKLQKQKFFLIFFN